jgi:hypothetical protein
MGTEMEGAGTENLMESWSQIKVVQSLIERCLQQYMTQVRLA